MMDPQSSMVMFVMFVLLGEIVFASSSSSIRISSRTAFVLVTHQQNQFPLQGKKETTTRSHSFLQYSKKKANFEDDEQPSHYPKVSNQQIRYLGKGKDAIVRPGVVMLAPSHEFHHFYRQAAIFVHGMGYEDGEEDGAYLIRGVILDHPTPFTIGEMTDDIQLQLAELSNNMLFRGGGTGNDCAMLLHNQAKVGDGEMIGTSGIYQGGLEQACQLVEEEQENSVGTAAATPTTSVTAQPPTAAARTTTSTTPTNISVNSDVAASFSPSFRSNFKFFFNYCEFTETELEKMFEEEIDSQGDAWISVEVPPEIVLADWDRGDAWKRLRNAVAHYWK